MSNIISEMCTLLGMKKMWTMSYHHQMNGLVERSHQTIMWMIGKLGEDEKANWPGHLAEIVHAYKTTWSVVMGYSPHYLMFGCRPRLPVNFYFPTWGLPFKRPKPSLQKRHKDWKIGALGLKPGDLILIKANAFQGKRKIKNRWEDKPHEPVCQIMTDIPWYEVKDQHGHSHVLDLNWLLLMVSETGVPLQVGVYQAWDRCTSPTPVKPTPRGSDSKTKPQEGNSLVITQCQARKTSLVWINRKLQLLLWTSATTSIEGGWRFQVMCSGCGHLHWQNGQKDWMHLVEGWISTHRYHWIVEWTTATTAHRAGTW